MKEFERDKGKTDPKMSENEAEPSAAERFAATLASFERFYLWLVVAGGALCATAVVLAVLVRVSIGLALAIATALAYRYLLAWSLAKGLGLHAKNRRGRCTVSLIRGEEEAFLPERLLWLDVTCLSAAEKVSDGEKVRVLTLPRTLRRIETGAMDTLVALERIEFCGTEEEWQAMEKPESLPACEIVCMEIDGVSP